MAAPSAEPSSGSPTYSASSPKPIHSLILDTGPLIKNDPPTSVLIAKAEKLYTLPSIIPEIRDPVTRSCVETTLLLFVTLRSPKPESVKFVQEFARKTGDLAVLSKPDLLVLALGYELECERNGGDWRLRNAPSQKGLNGRPNQADGPESGGEQTRDMGAEEGHEEESQPKSDARVSDDGDSQEQAAPADEPLESSMLNLGLNELGDVSDAPNNPDALHTDARGSQQIAIGERAVTGSAVGGDETREQDEADDGSDDEGGWITPFNVKKHQAQDAGTAIPAEHAPKTLQAAILTSDYAMQNVALRMNLNLVTPSLARITRLKNWVLRCHGCFSTTKEMDKQFCPSCGQPTLMRASCSTDEHGNFKIHLKKNFQWSKRGNVYSVPKPVHGSANGRLPKNAGGKDGWGRDLILAEDQKEYTRASDERRRARIKDLMDEDHLPSILTGDRSGPSGKIRVGAGRNVNAKRKH